MEHIKYEIKIIEEVIKLKKKAGEPTHFEEQLVKSYRECLGGKKK